MLLTTIAQFFEGHQQEPEKPRPQILDVEFVEPGDIVYVPELDVYADVEAILPDPFCISELDAEMTAYVRYFDADNFSYATTYLYEDECYTVIRPEVSNVQ